MKPILANSVRLLATFWLLLGMAGSLNASQLLQELDPVGSARLKVLLWTIYDSRLYSRDGNFDGIEPGLALQITYRRDIKATDLVDRTRKEWRRLSLYDASQESWLTELQRLWPDVEDGDSLVLHVDEQLASQFYLNDEPLGNIAAPEFTRAFLSIWLSEHSSYPRLRDQLVGENS